MSINCVVLVGNLTRDPEEFSAGCKFGLAVNERVKRNDEWTDYASFFEVVVFGKQADAVVKHLAKGRQVGVSGRLRQERWETDSGDKRSMVKVYAHEVQFLGSRPENGGDPGSRSEPVEEDRVPF